MLRSFIVENRDEILGQAAARATSKGLVAAELTHGLPVFLDQIGDALRKATLHEVVDHRDIQNSASHHGDHLFHRGLTVAQVINGYGDVCQIITGLAVDRQTAIEAAEFQTLNL